jgi:predicted lipid-binding transport protein (Tim44 family)
MRALALTLAATAAVVSACGGSSGEPRTAPPVSTSPASASTPSPEATGIDAPGPQGAAAFARFFYAQIQRAFETGDVSVLQKYSRSECETCQNFISSVNGTRAAGGRVEGYKITVLTAVAPADTGATARVDIVRNSTESIEYDKHGKVVDRAAGHKGIEEQMNLVRVNNSWQVSKMILIRVRG